MTTTNIPTGSNDWLDGINASDDYIKDMLSFYNEGWGARGIDDKKQIENRLKANITLTFAYIKEIFDELTKIKIFANSSYIKLNSVSLLTVLIAVPIDDYLRDDFTKIYSFAHEIQRSSNSINYSVVFNFTFDDGTLDDNVLSADGYYKSHSKT